jgi:hypothetical protein
MAISPNVEAAKTNPLRDIVEQCPERCAKDLEQHAFDTPKVQKQTHF